MSDPQKWDWAASNGDATAEETTAAYTALTTGGRTRDFVAAVWNDIIAKISAQRISWRGKEWDASILSLDETKLSAGENMTAAKFNAAVSNIWPVEDWLWAETLGRTTINRGDRCYGAYFLYLTDGLNHWIEDLTPLFTGFELQANAEISPDIRLCTAFPLQINLSALLDATCNMGAYPALKIKALLNITDDTQISLKALKAFVLNIPISVDSDIEVSVKSCIAAMLRIINFVQSKTTVGVKDCIAVPFDVICNATHNGKCTILTGELAYTAFSLSGISNIQVTAKTPSALYLITELDSEHSGSCNIELPPCMRFSIALGGIFNTSAAVVLPQALRTSVLLDGGYEGSVRAWECLAMYLLKLELAGQYSSTVSALAATVQYLVCNLHAQLDLTVTGLLAAAAYLSFDLNCSAEIALTASVLSVLSTGFQLNAQADTEVSVSLCHTANFAVGVQSEATVTAGVKLLPVEKVKVNLAASANITVDARFANKELVLAAEIDDVLVSTLDDGTVDSVETKFT